MSLVSAILFNAPPPVFHGHIRKIIAREMIEKVPASTQTAPTGKRPGAHELGRILRANIENLLQDGEKMVSSGSGRSARIIANIHAAALELPGGSRFC